MQVGSVANLIQAFVLFWMLMERCRRDLESSTSRLRLLIGQQMLQIIIVQNPHRRWCKVIVIVVVVDRDGRDRPLSRGFVR
jgi:hypothetical protein